MPAAAFLSDLLYLSFVILMYAICMLLGTDPAFVCKDRLWTPLNLLSPPACPCLLITIILLYLTTPFSLLYLVSPFYSLLSFYAYISIPHIQGYLIHAFSLQLLQTCCTGTSVCAHAACLRAVSPVAANTAPHSYT